MSTTRRRAVNPTSRDTCAPFRAAPRQVRRRRAEGRADGRARRQARLARARRRHVQAHALGRVLAGRPRARAAGASPPPPLSVRGFSRVLSPCLGRPEFGLAGRRARRPNTFAAPTHRFDAGRVGQQRNCGSEATESTYPSRGAARVQLIHRLFVARITKDVERLATLMELMREHVANDARDPVNVFHSLVDSLNTQARRHDDACSSSFFLFFFPSFLLSFFFSFPPPPLHASSQRRPLDRW